MIVDEEFVFQTSLVHPGKRYFVTNALRGDSPVNINGYLVMVNEYGDRVAFRVPNGEWEIDSKTLTGYNPDIPSYLNAIPIPMASLENE
ncbi:hypothetical protein L7F69_001978 [Escherichia coli]|uniref:hypothetical protein n=1 Tax=Citrobacter braakii TaxID=57706 RepID=UPI001BD01914|nr:hypothetical protein [Citrobacter braakii]EIV7044117.1 hypothetical protein [Escherichia coli]EKR5513080.1 hypothetical protein [Escherichia coli]ELZ3075932.1 hypothetical protein [Escherichia coli]